MRHFGEAADADRAIADRAIGVLALQPAAACADYAV